MPVTPQIHLVGTLKDLFGVNIPFAKLVFQLCGFGSVLPRISGTTMLAQTSPLETESVDGNFAIDVWGNDVILPAGTFYTVQVQDDNGNVIQTNAYLFTGAGSFDLSTIAPYNPPPPAIIAPNPVLLNPAGTQTIAGNIIIQGFLQVTGAFSFGGLVTLVFSATPVFDAADGSSFELTLTGNVASSTMVNTFAGQIVTFIFIQDAVGGRTFVWPANVKNATDIDAAANSITTQSFVARANGNLYPIGPGIYS